jgi:hypothetical protein
MDWTLHQVPPVSLRADIGGSESPSAMAGEVHQHSTPFGTTASTRGHDPSSRAVNGASAKIFAKFQSSAQAPASSIRSPLRSLDVC